MTSFRMRTSFPARYRYLLIFVVPLGLLLGLPGALLVGTLTDAGLFFAALVANAAAVLLLRPNSSFRRHVDGFLPAAWDRRVLAFGLFAAGGAALFGKIAEDVTRHESSQFDRAVSLWIHHFDNPVLDKIMEAISSAGSFPVLMYVAVMVLTWCWRSKDFGAFAGLLGVIAADETLNRILKNMFDRPRPTLFEEIATLHSYSFPSGHAMAAVANYGMMAVVIARLAPQLKRWVNGAFLTFALLVGISRIYLGVHWVTDVLAGYAAGAAILFAGILWLEANPPNRIDSHAPAGRASRG